MGAVLSGCFPGDLFNAEIAKEKNTLGTEIKKARKLMGLKQSDVVCSLRQYGVEIGIAALSRWEQGSNMPNPYQFLALCKILGIDNPYSLIHPDHTSVSIALHLNAAGIQKVKTYISDLESTGKYAPHSEKLCQESHASIRYVSFPVSMLKASAGTGQYLGDDAFEYIDIPESEIPLEADFGVYIAGDSMTPRFQDGQLVFIKQTHELRDGEIGLFILDGEGFVKQFHTSSVQSNKRAGSSLSIMLRSLNPAYAPKYINEESDFRIIGKVL